MGIFDRILSWVGFEVVDDDEEGLEETAATVNPTEEDGEEARPRRERVQEAVERVPERNERAVDRANLVSIPGGTPLVRMIVFTPEDFDQVQLMADHLKNRRPVVLNLEGVDKELAQRILNFLSGTIYALNGEMHRVASNVLLFAPGNVEIIHESPAERPEF
ncbi:MAG TPA: cell division protein SepF [Sphingobacteriaceae bacterium]|nr:cell division protein SepF [Sphingobacteriaceae bacterium]